VKDMNPITEEDLVLLYYGEHDDTELAARVAQSPELSERMEAIGRVLELTDHSQPPAREAGYGAEVWQRIASRLDSEPDRTRPSAWSRLIAPRFSFAGMAGIAAVTVLAFLLGRQDIPTTPAPVPLHDGPGISGFNSQRLLNMSVSKHLEQLNVGLTEFANSRHDDESGWATDMLVANRLYRQVAADAGDTRLAGFLTSLEPLLIELAYTSYRTSPASQRRLKQEVSEGLLFRIRVMNQQLNQPAVST